MDFFEQTPIDQPSRWTGLRERVISGVALALPVLLALWLGGWIFTLLVICVALQMSREWDGLTQDHGTYWKIGGLVYVAVPCASLIWLRNCTEGLQLVLFIMFVVWATDIGAYFTGKRIGGPKLAPSISPGKTWAGLGGGVVAAAIVGAICTSFSPYPPSIIAGLDMGILLAVVAQVGDLFESWLKRRAGVKDSATLIPGHGSLLDRVDGLIFPLPIFALFVYLAGIVS